MDVAEVLSRRGYRRNDFPQKMNFPFYLNRNLTAVEMHLNEKKLKKIPKTKGCKS